MADTIEEWLEAFPGGVTHPFPLSPAGLYAVSDLYDTYCPGQPATWPTTYDQKSFAWFYDEKLKLPRRLNPGEAIAARLHDAAIQQAIDGFLGRDDDPVVGFMGGHDVPRRAASFRSVALMARALRRNNRKIVTGGGPGLMEAANFGAFLAGFPDDAFEPQLDILRRCEFVKSAPAPWIDSACTVRTNLLGDWRGEPADARSHSLGIPTWLYGEEPPNLFATHIGKYFFNSVREDGLVSVASGGLVFAPGNAGTVQEIFQNATINYYTHQRPTPMVFFGRNFWHPALYDARHHDQGAQPKPAFPLIEKLARDSPNAANFLPALLIEDDRDAIVEFLLAFNPGSTPAAQRLAAQAPALTKR